MSQESEDLRRVTTAADVIALLELTDELGIQIWIEGGWAVDANLGRETRAHADVDIVVELGDLGRLAAALGDRGYVQVPRDDTRPENFVLGDRHGREVDFHVIEFDPVTGDGIYGPPERGDRYPREALGGRGSILGREVRCITPAWLVRWHTGYVLDANDLADVTALCEQFGIPLPDEYVALAQAFGS